MIQISCDIIKEIISDGIKCYPSECCGIIFGSVLGSGEKVAAKVQPVSNTCEKGEEYHRFHITPEEMLRAEKYARNEGCEIVGFYHSHPDCPADPSEFDREHALPVYSYIIASAGKGKVTSLKSWELSADSRQFSKEEIKVSSQRCDKCEYEKE